MRIAGVGKGKNRGNVVELTVPRKVLEAVKLGATTAPEFAHLLVTVEVKEEDIRSTSQTVEGEKYKDGWANNRYKASGVAKFWFRKPAENTVQHPKLGEWTVEFIDILDGWGMPEIEIVKFAIADPAH